MKQLVSVVTPAGQSEVVDPRVLPNDKLRVAQNVRFRKDGRAAKRYGNQAVGFSLGTGQWPNFISGHRGRYILTADTLVRSKFGSTVSATGCIDMGYVSRFLPQASLVVRRTENTVQPDAPTVGVSNGKVGFFWEEDGVIKFKSVRSTLEPINGGTFDTGLTPHAAALGDVIMVLYKSGTDVKVRDLNCLTDDTTVGSGATTIGTLGNSIYRMAAAPFSSTQWLVVWQNSATQITLALLTGTSITASATTTVASGAVVGYGLLGTTGENIYLSWVDTNGELWVKVYNTSLGAVTGAATSADAASALNANTQPQLVRASSTSATLVWSAGQYGSGVGNSELNWRSVTNASVLGTARTVYNVRQASRAFTADSSKLTRIDLWVQCDLGTVWHGTRSLSLVTIHTDDVCLTYQLSGQPHVPVGSNGLGDFLNHLCPVVSTGNGWVTAVPTVIRTPINGVDTPTLELTGLFVNAFNESLRQAYRANCAVGPSVLVAGNVTDVHDRYAFESGFAAYPVATAAASAGGVLSEGNYLYRIVFEFLDVAGRRLRSSPSDPIAVTTTAVNKTVDLTIGTLPLAHYATVRPDTVRAHIYRTKVGGNTYYRITPNTGAPDAMQAAASFSYSDGLTSDASLDSEILYTDGAVLPNMPPPACRCIAYVRGRVVLGGLFVTNKVVVSKLLVEGEPAQFSNSDAFAIYLPEDVTAVAGLDDQIVIFSEESIFVVTGEGPNDQGAGAYESPRRIPSAVGCIDHRSVVETPDGIMFQSRRGIYLLPRGFSTPVFIGAEVQETLGQFPIIQCALLCVEQPTAAQTSAIGALAEDTVRFVCSDAETPVESRVLVYDLRTRGWIVDDMTVTMGVAGTWDGLFTFTRADCTQSTPVRQESMSVFGDNTGWAEMVLETGDIRPFGLTGWGDFVGVQITAEYRGQCTLTIGCWVDDEPLPDWGITLPTVGGNEQVGDVLYLEYVPKVRSGSSIRLRLEDTDYLSFGATEGVAIHGIQITASPSTGPRRMPATTHRGP